MGDLLGPHKDREIELMLSYDKDCAMVPIDYWTDEVETICDLEGFEYRLLTTAHNTITDMLVVRKGHEWRASQIEKIYARVRIKNFMSPLDHAKLGIALGYSKEAIQFFLNVKEAA